MTRAAKLRRRVSMTIWRLMNPLARPLAGVLPFWVLLETTGRKTGRSRQTPLASGPVEGRTTWIIAVHGSHSTFAKNIEANPAVRLKMKRRWHSGTAQLEPMDPDVVGRFGVYARMGPRATGIDPALVRIDLTEPV